MTCLASSPDLRTAIEACLVAAGGTGWRDLAWLGLGTVLAFGFLVIAVALGLRWVGR